MLAPNYSANDFQAALQKLMPRGRVWPTSPDSIQAKTLYGLAGIFEKNSADAAALLKDAFPLTTIGLLPEWESTLGLPDLDYRSTAHHSAASGSGCRASMQHGRAINPLYNRLCC